MNTQFPNTFRAAAILMIFIAGCRSGQEQPGSDPSDHDTIVTLDGRAFRPDLPDGHVLDTIIRADLDGKMPEELVVTSMRPDSMAPPNARIDYLQIYSFDSLAGRYRLLLSDSMRWGTSIQFPKLSNRRFDELAIQIESGGNDAIASRGMHIYSGADGTIRRVYNTSRGDPAIIYRRDGELPLIMVRGQYWPPFLTHAQAISYVDAFLIFRDGELINDPKELREYSMSSAQLKLNEYAALRKTFAALPVPADSLDQADSLAVEDVADTVHALFIPAAEVIISFRQAESAHSLRSFWNSEREFLERRLPPAQFQELEQLYGEAIR